MEKIKKNILVFFMFIGGLLLTLAGLGWIVLTRPIQIYVGLILLILSIVIYILPEKKKDVNKDKNLVS